jgi:hypothetical protein
MRAIAVFMMIQGHTIDTLLAPSSFDIHSTLFKIWNFNRGLTAPIFLFGSGFAYIIASMRKLENGRLPGTVIWKRLRWIGLLFLIGMLMHFPAATLGLMKKASPDQWKNFFQVDVLRLMSVTLLILLLLLLRIKSLNHLAVKTFSACAFFLLISPFVYTIHWPRFIPEFFSGFFSMESGSFFPIFPFASFLFAGAGTAVLYLRWKQQGRESAFPKYLFLIGAAVLVLSLLTIDVVFYKVFEHGIANENPMLFFLRMGYVLLLWSFVGFLLSKIHRIPNILSTVGQHTLLIYVFHVVILNGSPWFYGIKHLFGKSLHLLPVINIVVLLLIASMWLAYEINALQREHKPAYRMIPYFAMVLLASILVLD